MLKFIPYLTAISADSIGDIQNIENHVYQISDTARAVLFGEKTYPDGNTGIQTPSVDLLHDSFYLVKLCLFTVYILSAVVAVYLLRIRHKLKKHGKWSAYNGSAVMTAGQIARLVSVLALFGTYVIFANYQSGIPVAAGAVIGIVQMLCIAVCVISAVTSCIAVLSHKKRKGAYRSIYHEYYWLYAARHCDLVF